MISFDKDIRKSLEEIEVTNNSYFITGKAGTGKSTLIKYFTEHTEKEVLILAPTGVSAMHVGGSTIHSFFGLHPGFTVDDIYEKNYHLNYKKYQILEEVETIIIDEVSMLRADLLDCVHMILSDVFSTNEPFAGKQMIFVGDAFQLPPIVRSEEKAYFAEQYESAYFFSSHAYQVLNPKFLELTKVHRQVDEVFIDCLNAIRSGECTKEHLGEINARCGVEPDESKQVLTLVTTNANAGTINKTNLDKLPSIAQSSKAKVEGKVPKSYYMNEEFLIFKRQAQVMMLVNQDGYKNGSIGTLIEYNEKNETAVVEIEGERYAVKPYTWEVRKPVYNPSTGRIVNESIGSFTQLPFKLARAITIHKSQGLSFDNLQINLGSRSFASGQTYVALSRVRTLGGLYLQRPLTLGDVIVDRTVLSYMEGATAEVE